MYGGNKMENLELIKILKAIEEKILHDAGL